MLAKIYITLKTGVLDPQGKTIENSLKNLGFGDINEVKTGKFIQVKLDTDDKKEAAKMVDDICQKLLANTIIENYNFELEY
jgi:phosphoribosylformylglycinamidine synthase